MVVAELLLAAVVAGRAITLEAGGFPMAVRLERMAGRDVAVVEMVEAAEVAAAGDAEGAVAINALKRHSELRGI